MKPVGESDFVHWLSGRNLTFDKEWGYISFPGTTDDSRFWLQPSGVPRLVYLVSCLFRFVSPWKHITLFRQGGSWMPPERKSVIDQVTAEWLAPLRLPDSGTFALRFSRTEIIRAISLFTYQQMLGMCVWDDTYAIPDHAQQLIQTSHHNVIRVEFRKKDAVGNFVQKMKKEAFALPTHIPDKTFKIPTWMKNK